MKRELFLRQHNKASPHCSFVVLYCNFITTRPFPLLTQLTKKVNISLQFYCFGILAAKFLDIYTV